MRWVTRPWRQAFDFSGRATRREFWLFQLQSYALLFALIFALPLFGTDSVGAIILLVAILLLLAFTTLAALSAGVRRLHDHDKTGWLILLAAVPLIGWLFYLFMMLTPGTRGENSYGYDPRDGDEVPPEALEAVFS